MASAPWQLYDDREHYFAWVSGGTLWNAQRGGLDPSEIYTSTDLADALEQVGYDEDRHVLHMNESPEDFENF